MKDLLNTNIHVNDPTEKYRRNDILRKSFIQSDYIGGNYGNTVTLNSGHTTNNLATFTTSAGTSTAFTMTSALNQGK